MIRTRLAFVAVALPLLLSGCSAAAPATSSHSPSVAPSAKATPAADASGGSGGSAGGIGDACARLTAAQIQSASGVAVAAGTSPAGQDSASTGMSSCTWNGPSGPSVTLNLFVKDSMPAISAKLDQAPEGTTVLTIAGASRAVAVAVPSGGVILDARATNGELVQLLAFGQTMDQASALAAIVMK